mgnify:CR=1 FL=1|tara:strand:+ start:427 stop:741 length:315 start_codon:yes stop_codon:yes gene_type:complete
MIRAVGNKRLDLSDSEFEYYNELISHVDKSEFNGIFSTDQNGIILNVMPSPDKNSSLIVYFFLLNVSFNQRLRKLDSIIGNKYQNQIDELKLKVFNLENKINED